MKSLERGDHRQEEEKCAFSFIKGKKRKERKFSPVNSNFIQLIRESSSSTRVNPDGLLSKLAACADQGRLRRFTFWKIPSSVTGAGTDTL